MCLWEMWFPQLWSPHDASMSQVTIAGDEVQGVEGTVWSVMKSLVANQKHISYPGGKMCQFSTFYRKERGMRNKTEWGVQPRQAAWDCKGSYRPCFARCFCDTCPSHGQPPELSGTKRLHELCALLGPGFRLIQKLMLIYSSCCRVIKLYKCTSMHVINHAV